MVAIRGHFDGRVFVPDEAVDLPRNQRVIIHVEPTPAHPSTLPPPTPGASLLDLVGSISKEDLDLMSKAIEEECERIEDDAW